MPLTMEQAAAKLAPTPFKPAMVNGGPALGARDDGVLVPYNHLVAKLPNVRPYWGDPNATREQVIEWLGSKGMPLNSGQPQNMAAALAEQKAEADRDAGRIDPRKASKDELLAFAMEEFGLEPEAGEVLATFRRRVAEKMREDAAA